MLVNENTLRVRSAPYLPTPRPHLRNVALRNAIVVRQRTDQPVVTRLLDDVRDPARDARCHEDRPECEMSKSVR